MVSEKMAGVRVFLFHIDLQRAGWVSTGRAETLSSRFSTSRTEREKKSGMSDSLKKGGPTREKADEMEVCLVEMSHCRHCFSTLPLLFRMDFSSCPSLASSPVCTESQTRQIKPLCDHLTSHVLRDKCQRAAFVLQFHLLPLSADYRSIWVRNA